MKQEKESLLESTIRDCNCGTISVTTKVTKKCNIRPACKYCYDFDDSSSDMSIETLENLTKKSIASGDFGRVIFVWHGGEPLVMGRQFFSQALEFQKKYNPGNVKIENRIQTNAVAMGARWIEFLKENGFMMEASFDAFDNDFSRGETDKVLKNILLSKEMDYAPGNIMFIATKNNISRLRESFDYFHDLGLNFTPSPII